jgi:hypothetical protein
VTHSALLLLLSLLLLLCFEFATLCISQFPQRTVTVITPGSGTSLEDCVTIIDNKAH